MKKYVSNFFDDIAETLFIPLYMRALETLKSEPIINDPIAVKIVEKIEYNFSKYDKGKRSSLGVALRANYFDEKASRFVKNNTRPVIVNLGCGLDTRNYRINVDKNIFFYNLDLPEVIDLREKLIPEKNFNSAIKYENIRASIFESGWMDDLSEKHPGGDFIFIIEGVLMYFQEDYVKVFLSNLGDRFPGAEIHFDVVNKWMIQNSHRHDTVKHTRADFVWGIDNNRLPEEWNQSLKFKNEVLYCDFKEWKRLFFSGFIMKIIPKIKYAGRILEFEIIKH